MLLHFYAKAQAAWLDFRGRFRNDEGAVATEYVLLLVLIAIGIAATAGFLGSALISKFTSACNSVGGSKCS